MPIVIVIGHRAVPTSIVSLQGYMGPTVTGIVASNHDPLSQETEPPHVRRVDEGDARFDGVGRVRHRAQIAHRLVQMHHRIGVNVRNLSALSDLLDESRVAVHLDHVGNPKRLVGDPLLVERTQDGRLRTPRYLREFLKYIITFFQLGGQFGRAAEICLFSEQNEKIRFARC